MSSIRKNILFNGIANTLTKTVKVGEQLLLVPFFLTAWGAAYYGEWLTLSIIPSVLAFSDLGFGSAAASSFVLSYSAGDKKRAFDIFHTSVRIITWTVLLGVLLSALTMIVAKYTGLLAKSLITPDDAILALSLMMASRLLSFYNQLFEALYRATHHAALSVNLLTVEGFIRIAFGIFALSYGYGIVGFSVSQCIASLIYLVIYPIYGLKLLGERIVGQWNKKEAIDIIKKGFGFMFTPVWQSIYFQGSTFVVRIVLGPEAVAVFNTVRTVCRSVNQLYSIVNGSIFPELQCEYGAGNMQTVRIIFVNAVQFILFVSIIGVLFLCLFGPYIYSIWTHGTLNLSNGIWYIFIFGILFNAFWWTAGLVFRVINNPYKLAEYGLISAIVTTLCTFIFSKWWGLAGAAIGYLLMDVMMAVLILPTACKYIGVRVSDIFNIKTNRIVNKFRHRK